MRELIYFLIITFTMSQAFGEEPAGAFYRYRDQSGNIIVNNVLPPEFANSGYEILSSRGNVIERIPPKRTPDEIKADKEAEKLKKIEAEKRELEKSKLAAQAREDEILLKSFSTEQDIINLKESKIASIKVLENITKEHISQLNRQLDEARSAAANYERMGKPISDNVIKTIEESKRQITEKQNFLDIKENEKLLIKEKFAENLHRFKILKMQENN